MAWQKAPILYNKTGMTNIGKCLFYFCFVLTPIALAEESVASIIVCKQKKFVRTIRIISLADQEKENKCVTMYTKAGTDKIVGGGKNMWTCNNLAQNIKANLEKADWKCKEVPAGIEQHYQVE